MNDESYNHFSSDRIGKRQIDELIGIARGLTADGRINQEEAEFLQKWLAANDGIADQPLINTLYRRISEVLQDGILDQEEAQDLFVTLRGLTGDEFELGEVLKSTTLPYTDPPPRLSFPSQRYCFTGTFSFGQRRECEKAVRQRGAECGGITQKTNVLVVGTYATDSWLHSTMGTKILKAVEWRDRGFPIAIVSEDHWVSYL